MTFHLTNLSDLDAAGFDDLIDARSPDEFAEDRVPGAISLPVLDNDERARVGTMYVQQSRFGARKMGAALVLRNVAHHVDTALADRDGAWRPLVYCWRGGQRSGTFGWLLREIGWRAEILNGGYRTYRRLVVEALYDRPLAHRLVVLEGMTCTGKTALLHRLAERGAQVLDLEGLARHRGSVFGGQADPQPSQKWFESTIARTLSRFDPARPVLVEAESSKVGNLLVPPQIWRGMIIAPRVQIEVPLAARAAFFPHAYADLVADPAGFSALIGKLKPLHGAARIAEWQGLVAEGAFQQVAAALMLHHYDPRYGKSADRHSDAVVAGVHLDDLSPDAVTAALPELEAAIELADNGAVAS
ncbi:tRNA 2-selenouridine(34) synthase MnmH [Pseudoruegeria sp. SK021]|uniref:tRNA 2-selenouridine(34) synthase MnmH n=1 Tax=Pseudoruegeria sp. SK021 TaxID=1933035 RepID=UPI000A239134|nr:tRNA 2-selenouridine(34) synthase MnmH [Pseudoruegeria sp. SK021]OSP54518.1 tRNA 2-selenouridine(34) synthase MnmH [Pseudoruegeria sp. SK021]